MNARSSYAKDDAAFETCVRQPSQNCIVRNQNQATPLESNGLKPRVISTSAFQERVKGASQRGVSPAPKVGSLKTEGWKTSFLFSLLIYRYF
jgi:hypothetical protein